MLPLDFLQEIKLCATFVRFIFRYNQYLLQCSVLKGKYFRIPAYYISNMANLRSPLTLLFG